MLASLSKFVNLTLELLRINLLIWPLLSSILLHFTFNFVQIMNEGVDFILNLVGGCEPEEGSDDDDVGAHIF